MHSVSRKLNTHSLGGRAMRSRLFLIFGALVLFSGLTGFTDAASFQDLGDLPGGSFLTDVTDVSADGSVAVGRSNSVLGGEAFIWEGGIMIGLGDLLGGDFFSLANGISADGSVVVGFGHSALGREAVCWDTPVFSAKN